MTSTCAMFRECPLSSGLESRHSTAMHLLQSGVDISVIALWLGHESPTTTHHYVEAGLAMTDRALARLKEPKTPLRRYRAPSSICSITDC
jgi:integrase